MSHTQPSDNRLSQKPDTFWKAANGPLTQQRALHPGKFGLGRTPAAREPDATTKVVCGFCATGCSLNIHLRNGEAINLTPTVDYPVNRGAACPKGWESLSVLRASDRGTTPLLRNDRGKRQSVEWPQAMREFCDRFQQIQARHGNDSVAFLSTGQLPSEEMAFLGALSKFGMGLTHGDGNTRQCMATSVVAYKQSFGFDAPPYTYQDLEDSDVIVLIGSNLCITHPIMWQRVLKNPHQPEILVIDPRRTETAMAGTQHIPLRPKSDLALLYGLANILIQQEWLDRDYIQAHTEGFDAFRDHVAEFTPARVSQLTGLPADSLGSIARTIQAGERVSFWWTMGVNQSYEGVRTAQAIINLALMTGNIGRPGTGANSITGQCNAMGSRLFSNTTNLLGGRDFRSSEDRQAVADILGFDVTRIPDQPSWSYDQIIEGILREKIKGLWVICTNTAHSWINQNTCHEILDRLDFLVVQDMYSTTETAQRADLYLPAAGWGEKEGTFINSERRIGAIKKVTCPPGQALSDFAIFRLIAEHWGCGTLFADWQHPAAVFEKLKQLSRGQPCDITGIRDYAMLEAHGGIQWPCSEHQTTGNHRHENAQTHFTQRRLFEDGNFYHPDGRARFHFEAPRQMPEPPTPRYPYLLLTGRGSAAQWHTQTRTSKSTVLRQLAPQRIYLEINPLDARREGIRPDQDVIVESQRGRLRARSVLTPTVQPGQVFLPMHFSVTNKLTLAHFDPYSRQPSYKNCAVRVRKAEPADDV
ncbi:MAG TPA: nitrate reductase [Planctomycetaceae bacterium]|nr:nitrate reductase [Planctomycetaceae bacterium]|tara:strand:- start:7327 stop:9597 length:2271 start_codon:yes stop_codon:yes gene_type:complete